MSERRPTMATPQELQPLHVPTRRIVIWGLAAWLIALIATVAIPPLHSGDRA